MVEMQGGVFGAVADSSCGDRGDCMRRAVARARSSFSKRFGALAALDDVSVKVQAGSFHALLGENGAGKSTLVKCAMGYYAADAGPDPARRPRGHDLPSAPGARARARHGLPALHPGAEHDGAGEFRAEPRALPAVIDWAGERAALDAFFSTTPFRVPFDVRWPISPPGEKQKGEILQPALPQAEPADPRRADVGAHARRGRRGPVDLEEAHRATSKITIITITHKFREVNAYATR